MEIDPKITFYLGLITCIALILSNGTIWVGALSDAYVPAVTAWSSIIGQVGTGVMTFLTGMSSAAHERGPIAKMLRPH